MNSTEIGYIYDIPLAINRVFDSFDIKSQMFGCISLWEIDIFSNAFEHHLYR